DTPIALNVVRSHHERFDGRGVPDGLKAGQIPLEARIAAVADSVDAMTSGRPYRGSELTLEDALRELQVNSDTQFDRRVVEATLNAAQAGQFELIPHAADVRVAVSL